MKPIIGMTACRGEGDVYKTNDTYVKAVVRAGGIPVMLPIANRPEDCPRLAKALDALLVPGGVDVAPQYYGEEPRDTVTCVDRELDAFELALIRETAKAGKPIFAICRGIQVVNVAFGGTLWQDIPSQCPEAHGHYQKTDSRSEEYHTVKLLPGTHLREIFGEEEILTNSYHHQAVRELAPGFAVSARTADGIVEGMENRDGSIIAVQWHPECMEERHPVFRRFFNALVARASK